MEIHASSNLSKSQCRLWISKQRVQDEDMVMNEGWGKAVGQEINSGPFITFVQGQQGPQLEPLEILLSFLATFAFTNTKVIHILHFIHCFYGFTLVAMAI